MMRQEGSGIEIQAGGRIVTQADEVPDDRFIANSTSGGSGIWQMPLSGSNGSLCRPQLGLLTAWSGPLRDGVPAPSLSQEHVDESWFDPRPHHRNGGKRGCASHYAERPLSGSTS